MTTASMMKQGFKKEFGALATVAKLVKFTGMSRQTIDRTLEESGVVPTMKRKRTRYYYYADAIDAVLGRMITHG